MRAGWFGVSMCLLVGCVAVAPQPNVSTPSVRPEPSPQVTGWEDVVPAPSPLILPEEGFWAISEFGEPEPTPTAGAEQRPLWNFPSLRLGQVGGTMSLTRNEYCGKPSEEATGAVHGYRVRLEGMSYVGQLGTALIYDLTFDAATRRFRGTRNGRPVWLGPTEVRPSPASLCSMEARGRVFDTFGEVIRSAKVRVVSNNPSNPVESTVDVQADGTYWIRGLPGLVSLLFTVEAEGMKPTTREVVIERGPAWVVNFGGRKDREDPEGWRFPMDPIVQPSPTPSGASGMQLF